MKNRDGLLNEIEKMELEEHINACPDCAAYVKEMNCCLDMLVDLPELAPSENFEWNLKRAIIQEKTKRARSAAAMPIGEWRWGVKFIASAASIAAVVLVGTWFALRGPGEMQIRSARTAGQSTQPKQTVTLTPSDYGIISFTSGGYERAYGTDYRSRGNAAGAVQPLMVDGSGRAYRYQTTQFGMSSREDSLAVENEFLWQRLESLEREVMVLHRLLSQERSKR